jgi:hypothetical protein
VRISTAPCSCITSFYLRETQLRVQNYERFQRFGEPLAVYVQSVRDAALVLRIKETEQHTFARIFEGLTPIQRARFVFQTLPTKFVH